MRRICRFIPWLQDDPELGRADGADHRELCAFAIEEDAAAQFLGVLRMPEPVERHLVFFLHFVARMGEVLCEIAVARHQEQPLRSGHRAGRH